MSLERDLSDERYERERLQDELRRTRDSLAEERENRRQSGREMAGQLMDCASQEDVAELTAKVIALADLLIEKGVFTAAEFEDVCSKRRFA